MVYISPSVQRVLGYEPDELLNTTLADICLPEQRAMGRLCSAYFLKKDSLIQGSSFVLKHKNGEHITVEAFVSVSYNLRTIILNQIEPEQAGRTKRAQTVERWFAFKADGAVTAKAIPSLHFLAVPTNLSPSNHAMLTRLQHELFDNGESLQLTPQPRVVFALQNTADPNIVYVSSVSQTLLGVESDTLINNKLTNLVHPDQKEYVLEKIKQVREELCVCRLTFLFQSTVGWVKLNAVCCSCSDAILLIARNYRPSFNMNRVLDSASSASEADP
ncbi:hypothetical protein K493DRAFT_335294 [Basidiobolus meristosporus CBS 931.73]|uniref:PAS domain-containing protein n=1 Tax=Basidiobolus meristosporus CBS 931.73 TaxID=1314790 RepID=A0A1Y1YR99_9FUNG|nr:hypothetical protein K493DRAFT_335294 [Basidiobolus meristosporus CBS 931.73]|eukprot:ORY00561.1 hypothetical protein K493DRAFT_335294 [Basidiobolus meristosporus CBS 931.73]